ncbi:hypothetical protein PHYSODRAFT_304879 [Phytophthora sojae]|uniref:Uncharacterized protein n=1 Tax=Phytophthora sojae (strain P6497) TaxID=1094619 RepID=G5A0I7_PHYSP|nr:hypothetical protein PHYSODRAFT_304879 [Phytophthora sojae]EGZ11376.1 hypothetical protein PHYSODRAFT_304879 [Phytophthora sojae]|eukprot:XP_009534121.1 hypothetical protein PHYSODRAFT_304879 [Phytophthora sojae]
MGPSSRCRWLLNVIFPFAASPPPVPAMKLAIPSLLVGLVLVSIASPLNLVAAQDEQSDPTPASLVASGVLENRTVTTSAFVNETTTVVTTVLWTEEEQVEEEEEDGDASLSSTPDATAEPQTDDNSPTTYLVNETIIVVTTVQGYRNVTTSVLRVLTPVDEVADDDDQVEDGDDDGVKELLDPAVASTVSNAK